jgi:hypothetical protein
VPGWDDAPLRPQGRAVAAARGLGCCGRWRLRRVAAAEVRDSGRAVDTDTQQYRPVAAAAAPVTRVPTRRCASGARAARDRRGASARAGERPFSAAVLTGICLHAACSCHELLTEEWERPPGQPFAGLAFVTFARPETQQQFVLEFSQRRRGRRSCGRRGLHASGEVGDPPHAPAITSYHVSCVLCGGRPLN